MNEFQWLLVLGFPAEIAAVGTMPAVFASESTVTANDLLACPEHRSSPSLPGLFVIAA